MQKSATSMRQDKRLGRIRQEPIQQLDFLWQGESRSRRGTHRQEINRESTDGKVNMRRHDQHQFANTVE
jgi:hypothetical protein